jgi:hypothetical protein
LNSIATGQNFNISGNLDGVPSN